MVAPVNTNASIPISDDSDEPVRHEALYQKFPSITAPYSLPAHFQNINALIEYVQNVNTLILSDEFTSSHIVSFINPSNEKNYFANLGITAQNYTSFCQLYGQTKIPGSTNQTLEEAIKEQAFTLAGLALKDYGQKVDVDRELLAIQFLSHIIVAQDQNQNTYGLNYQIIEGGNKDTFFNENRSRDAVRNQSGEDLYNRLHTWLTNQVNQTTSASTTPAATYSSYGTIINTFVPTSDFKIPSILGSIKKPGSLSETAATDHPLLRATTLEEPKKEKNYQIVFAIDGSGSMAPAAQYLADQVELTVNWALTQIDGGSLEVAVVLYGDDKVTSITDGFVKAQSGNQEEIAKLVEAIRSAANKASAGIESAPANKESFWDAARKLTHPDKDSPITWDPAPTTAHRIVSISDEEYHSPENYSLDPTTDNQVACYLGEANLTDYAESHDISIRHIHFDLKDHVGKSGRSGTLAEMSQKHGLDRQNVADLTDHFFQQDLLTTDFSTYWDSLAEKTVEPYSRADELRIILQQDDNLSQAIAESTDKKFIKRTTEQKESKIDECQKLLSRWLYDLSVKIETSINSEKTKTHILQEITKMVIICQSHPSFLEQLSQELNKIADKKSKTDNAGLYAFANDQFSQAIKFPLIKDLETLSNIINNRATSGSQEISQEVLERLADYLPDQALSDVAYQLASTGYYQDQALVLLTALSARGEQGKHYAQLAAGRLATDAAFNKDQSVIDKFKDWIPTADEMPYFNSEAIEEIMLDQTINKANTTLFAYWIIRNDPVKARQYADNSYCDPTVIMQMADGGDPESAAQALNECADGGSNDHLATAAIHVSFQLTAPNTANELLKKFAPDFLAKLQAYPLCKITE